MASPRQPPPSPPPPRRGKRSRSPSVERESGAHLDPQLSPPGQSITSGHKEGAVCGLNPKLLNLKDRAIPPEDSGILEAKDGSNTINSSFYEDVSVHAQGDYSLFHEEQTISAGHKEGFGLNSDSNLKLTFLNLKGNEYATSLFGDRAISPWINGSPKVEHASNTMNSDFSKDVSVGKSDDTVFYRDLGSDKLKSAVLYEMTGCESFSYNELHHATFGFNEINLMPQFGPSVYKGCLSSIGKVLVKVYDKVQEKFEDYKEGVLRRFSPSRAHKNIIKLIGNFTDEKRLILVYEFPFELSLGDQLKVPSFDWDNGGLGTYSRYRIAVELAEGLDHIVKQDIPLIPKLFTEDHVFIAKGHPVLVDFIGAAQGIGRTFDSTLEIVRHYGILLGKLRAAKCANGVELPIHDKEWEKLEEQCIQENKFKRPSPEYIVYVMKNRMKELFSLTGEMHREFRLKYNLEW